MSHTKTALAEALASPQPDGPPPKLRSPSPPAPPHFRGPSVPPDSRAPSLAPPTPKSAAARLASPPPETQARATPSRDPTPAPATALSAVEPSPLAKSDSKSDADDEAEDVRRLFAFCPLPILTPRSPFVFQVDQEGVIDLDTFNQILDLDEDDTHEFSLGMTEAYFSQASSTFTDMDDAFEKKDLPKLSSLGHFLKGSSAALGVSAVQATCEHIQHYGALRDEETGGDLTQEDALAMIAPLLERVKREYAIAEKWLRNWYDENVVAAEA
uniref:Beta-xylanase (EC) n=1 Tax=Ganoderma boninense TaxID=34458 RepID=A0A5K1K533_9APHY|nr:Beta-xylanase (EC [Ganoderma boninense]